jgi:DNA primase
MTSWINFKELRARLDFEQVLRHHGVEVKRKGNQHHGYCPLPNHNGKKNSPSFSANLERGIFQCFGCGAKGNLLEFSAMMQNVDLGDGTAFREVALELQKRFCPNLGNVPEGNRNAVQPKQQPVEATKIVPTIINAPLNFELKGLDPKHPYLLRRGFSPETIAHFGLGFCSRGMLKDRIAIPLHDHAGHLVGYAGRVVDDTTINEDNPRYRLPGERKRDGKIFEFRKTFFLYNGFRIKAPVDDLIIVEGFTSVWWLWQCGWRNVVGLMGWSCSDEQAGIVDRLVSAQGRVWLLLDDDNPGNRGAESALMKVAPLRFIRWVRLTDGNQPTDLVRGELEKLLK